MLKHLNLSMPCRVVAESRKAVWVRAWKTLDPRMVALLGAILILAISTSVFGILHNEGFVQTLSAVAGLVFSGLGLGMLILAQVMAAKQNRHQVIVANVAMFTFITGMGMMVLAFAEDPVPFVSTMTAAFLSLGVAWTFQVMSETRQGNQETSVTENPSDNEEE